MGDQAGIQVTGPGSEKCNDDKAAHITYTAMQGVLTAKQMHPIQYLYW